METLCGEDDPAEVSTLTDTEDKTVKPATVCHVLPPTLQCWKLHGPVIVPQIAELQFAQHGSETC